VIQENNFYNVANFCRGHGWSFMSGVVGMSLRNLSCSATNCG
jgi:hypothetical protein